MSSTAVLQLLLILAAVELIALLALMVGIGLRARPLDDPQARRRARRAAFGLVILLVMTPSAGLITMLYASP
jgi:hypothetical protein